MTKTVYTIKKQINSMDILIGKKAVQKITLWERESAL